MLYRKRPPGRVFLLLLVALVLVLGAAAPAAADEWTMVYGDPGAANFSSADAVAVAPDGSIYVLGTFFGDFGGKSAIDGFDVFVMRLDETGAISWLEAWDPDSMDGYDYSIDDGLQRAADRGEIFVDGAGNVGFTLAGFVAFVDSDGNVIASSDNAVLGNVHQNVLAKAQSDSDGGAILADLDASNVVAVSSDLNVEWTAVHSGYNGHVVPLSDGGAVVVYDRPAEFSFQQVAQAFTAFGTDGAEAWNTLHYGRCSGVGPPSAGDGTLDVVVLAGDTSVLVGSRETDSHECEQGIQMLTSYSLSDGELLEDIALSHSSLNACAGAPLGSVVDFVEPGSCLDNPIDPANTWEWTFVEPVPAVANIDQTEFHSVVPVSIRNGLEEVHEALGLVRHLKIGSKLELDSVTRIGVADGVTVRDAAITAGGEVVVVGRSADGAAAISEPTASVSSAAAESVGSPQAFVVFDPDVTPAPPAPTNSFSDDDDSIFESDIEWLVATGVTRGCGDGLFCPSSFVTRGQMAAFLHRGLDGVLSPGSLVEFSDDDDSIFESDIEWLAATGVTRGCGDGLFCPSSFVTRGQMAAFLHRGLDGVLSPGSLVEFSDDDDSIFESDIEWLAATGVTRGCGDGLFCPSSFVTRGQMAAFLHRALDGILSTG